MTKKLVDLLLSLGEREFNYKETIQVLRHDISIFWSWGVSRIIPVKETGVCLKVSARRHKGYVYITLGWNDTYTVNLISTHGNIVKTFKDVYVDVLTETIDNEIEKIPEYSH